MAISLVQRMEFHSSLWFSILFSGALALLQLRLSKLPGVHWRSVSSTGFFGNIEMRLRRSDYFVFQAGESSVAWAQGRLNGYAIELLLTQKRLLVLTYSMSGEAAFREIGLNEIYDCSGNTGVFGRHVRFGAGDEAFTIHFKTPLLSPTGMENEARIIESLIRAGLENSKRVQAS